MKHFGSLLIAIAISTSALFAQEKNEFSTEAFVGIKGGVNCTTVSFLPEVEQSLSTHPNFGLMARYVAEKHFGIQGELNFSQRGWKEKTSGDFEYSRNMNYLEIPVLAHLYFGRKGRLIFNIGPEISFLIKDTEKSTIEGNDTRAQHANADKKFEYGLCAGIGFEHCFKKLRYAIEGRYYYGLGDFFDNGTQSKFERSAHRIISLNLVIMAPIKK